MLWLRHLRSAKSSVALCLEMCGPSSFQVIILFIVLHVRIALRPRLFSAQPTYRNSVEQLVRTVDNVIIAFLRNVSVSPERQRTLSRIFPVALAWSVSQRASRDINIQAAIEYVTLFLLVNLSFHTV